MSNNDRGLVAKSYDKKYHYFDVKPTVLFYIQKRCRSRLKRLYHMRKVGVESQPRQIEVLKTRHDSSIAKRLKKV